MNLLNKEAVEAVSKIGRVASRSDSTTINQGLLDNLCNTALLGLEAIAIVTWWRELHNDGYNLRSNEIETIDALLKRVGRMQRGV